MNHMINRQGDKHASPRNLQQKAVEEERKSPSKKTKNWPEVVKGILNPQDKLKIPKWSVFFRISCAIAVFIDPLYCYVAVVDHKKTCYHWDQTLMWTFMGLRSAVDLFYIFDIFHFVQQTNISWATVPLAASTCWSRKKNDAAGIFDKKKKSSIRNLFKVLPRIFVALPILQAAILVGKYTDIDNFNLFLVTPVQYIMRVYYLYESLRELPNIATNVGRFFQALLDLLPFLLAAHLFGALWYGLALEREVDCWTDNACLNATNETICNPYRPSYFYCNQTESNNQTKRKNITITHVKEACNIHASPPMFDFGIYHHALQSGMTSSSTSLHRKLFQCFWWGLRNLSSFGSNLQTGPRILEIILSVLASITGLVLFLVYLNARVQALRNISIMKKKGKMISLEVDLWLSENQHLIPRKDWEPEKKKIMKKVLKKLKEKNDVDVNNILSILPRGTMDKLRLDLLKKVPMFEHMNEQVLEAICEHLKAVMYTEGFYIIKEGRPLEMMLFITQGTAWTYTTNSTNGAAGSSFVIKYLKRGDLCGEELLNCISRLLVFSEFPISTKVVKAQTRIIGFALRADDLKSVVYKFWRHVNDFVEDSQLPPVWKHVAASCIQRKWRFHFQKREKKMAPPQST